MKKIFTLIAAAVTALSMSATDFLYFYDEPVVDGQTYYAGYECYEEEEYQGVWYYNWMNDSHLYFKGVNGVSVTCSVLLEEGSGQFCGISNLCKLLSVGVADARVGIISSDEESLQLETLLGETEGDESPASLAKTATIKVTAYLTDDEDGESDVSITIRFLEMSNEEVIATYYPDMNGITSAVADNACYIKMSTGDTLNYSVDGTQSLALYAITGAKVANYQIQGTGTLNLSSLPKGIYIYTEGTHKGKILVK